MYQRTNAEWNRLYRQVWRPPIAHLPKEIRAKLVRGCARKDVYESPEEALPVIAQMEPRPKLYLKCYACPLCSTAERRNYHIGNSRTANTMPERAIDPNKTVARLHGFM